MSVLQNNQMNVIAFGTPEKSFLDTLASNLRLDRFPLNLLKNLHHWMERSRQRRLMLELDDAMLKDLGITRNDVLRESSKAGWTK